MGAVLVGIGHVMEGLPTPASVLHALVESTWAMAARHPHAIDTAQHHDLTTHLYVVVRHTGTGQRGAFGETGKHAVSRHPISCEPRDLGVDALRRWHQKWHQGLVTRDGLSWSYATLRDEEEERARGASALGKD
jgi:hypothetical protein